MSNNSAELTLLKPFVHFMNKNLSANIEKELLAHRFFGEFIRKMEELRNVFFLEIQDLVNKKTHDTRKEVLDIEDFNGLY